ncbi:carbamoyl-phosphate synthase (glutamine-hydrolyzing) large subunit [Hymenobacter bucti]|uniref:carbamoyl-phosphate synthase (ammonia) n=1 Tax=Hymenobacter bucti TaxID=1844114 RepID=A0ABW4QYY0_9BACT
MNKPTKVLVLGSGALKIGEAGEFDYSGSQALKALKEEGIRTILINPNIATVQTSDGMADDVYFLPVTPYFVEEVIKKEQPDGILVAFGGQTALNCAVALYRGGVFEKYNVRVLGTPVQSIIDTEDRDIFKDKLDQIGVLTARSVAVTTMDAALAAGEKIGFPIIVRAAFALGGLGSGFANNMDELRALAEKSFNTSDQILVEESLKGWKEVEYEVVRDAFDNCITVCNMENFDPIGIHTGESIVVAPSQTLSNREYHKLRSIGIKTIRHLGIVGECNIQYALDPVSEDYRVIEVNARLSRSSALASKATGYPLAFVAAKLSLGYSLAELKNSVTQTTTAFFEPALDYVVVKLPRWDLGKFAGVQRQIGSAMKSVGEVMAIGKSFEEAIQKGLRMLDTGKRGFVGNAPETADNATIDRLLNEPNEERIFAINQAFEAGYTLDQVHELTKIDHWFLQRLYVIFELGQKLAGQREKGLEGLEIDLLREAKKAGFSDQQLAVQLLGARDVKADELRVRAHRKALGVLPVVKQIDTLAAEFPAKTNYLYLTYHGTENDLERETEKSIAVLGSGVYRIGSSVEFDWCGVNAVQTAAAEGYKTLIINYNPETVSTDYDVSDRLYFEELSYERVMDILDFEQPTGVILSTGGQIPNNLATRLDEAGAPILGTSAKSIDMAENRHKFSSIMDELGIAQPRWNELTSLDAMHTFVGEVGYPVLIRPSYVLSGAAMNVVSNPHELEEFLKTAAEVSAEYPVVVSEFIQEAKEIELDAVADHGEIVSYAISEHVEFAGVHSGDATMYYPPQRVYVGTIRKLKNIAEKIAKRYDISGPFNIQFLEKHGEIRVIECNIRASRSFPFVSKISGNNLVTKATQVLLGKKDIVRDDSERVYDLPFVGVKAPQFSFTRLPGADPVLRVDMVSTGEVGCLGDTAEEALLKSMLSVGYKIPEKTVLISGGPIKSKVALLAAAELLVKKGYQVFATQGTHRFFAENKVPSSLLFWPDDHQEPNVLTYLREKKIDLVINVPKNLSKGELDNDYKIRRTAIDFGVPLLTNARLASKFIRAFCSLGMSDLKIKSWNEYKAMS